MGLSQFKSAAGCVNRPCGINLHQDSTGLFFKEELVIGLVKQEHNVLLIYDEKGIQRATMAIPSGHTFKGYSNSIIVTMKDHLVIVFNDKGFQKAAFSAFSGAEFLAVVGETIQFKEGNRIKICDSNGYNMRYM
jgi:hypothetical protein